MLWLFVSGVVKMYVSIPMPAGNNGCLSSCDDISTEPGYSGFGMLHRGSWVLGTGKSRML